MPIEIDVLAKIDGKKSKDLSAFLADVAGMVLTFRSGARFTESEGLIYEPGNDIPVGSSKITIFVADEQATLYLKAALDENMKRDDP